MAHIQRVPPMLGEVADADIVAEDSFSFLNRKGPSKKFEKSGFTCSVGAYKDGALAALGFEVQPPINGQISGSVGIGIGMVHLF